MSTTASACIQRLTRSAQLSGLRRWPLALAGISSLAALGLGGCKSGYSADVRNGTPQPLYVQVLTRNNAGTMTIGSQRLGPGDRRGMGPYTVDQREVVWLRLDTLPNPQRPVEMTLRPGLSVLEVTQAVDESGSTTAGPLLIREIGGGQ